VDDFVNSLIEQGEVQGFLPIWALWGKENFCMIGNHGVSVIAEAYRKGFRTFRKVSSIFFFSHTTGHVSCRIIVIYRFQSGLIGQYAHGNEPSHHVTYLYALAGRPERTQELIREIFDTQYKNKPDGLCGNDDCGQMSAWYMFSAWGSIR